ncbi:uncharacterized protein LOC141802537 [Halichoeres trimaculatus]|uniref:uncharacterized protein LOC141802537 n=1 Tax=Halichoeres trimaculatus TaxID=147232 RepID=UPI003D9E97A0
MSKVQTVRGLIIQRLSAAAEEIFELFERTIAEYEEQLCRSKEENQRQQKLLEAVYNPEVRLHRADVQQLLVSPENVPCEQKERGLSLDQEDPGEPAHTKEEQEELWSHQETEQLHGLKEETTEFQLTPVPAKTTEEEGEEPESSQLHEKQTEEMLPSESETDDSSYYLEESSKPQSGLNHVSDMECNTVETPLSFSDCATSSDPKEPERDSRKIQKNKETFSCSVCGKCFREKSNMIRHQKTHKGDDGRMSGLNQLQIVETSSDVKCDSGKNLESSSECASSSEQKKKLQKLEDKDKKEKPFCCSVCKKRFSLKKNLKRHMKCHSGEKPFTCSVCGKGLTTKAILYRHMFCHSGEKPHSCSQCGKRFTAKHSLIEHILCHSGEKPFICSVCGKGFVRQNNLKSHSFVHSEEKPFICSVCGKSFGHQRLLKSHSFVHSGEKPYSCSQCGKSYFTPLQLTEHCNMHKGEKPYSCSLCDARFSYRRVLSRHAAVHTGKKPYSCDVCEKSFSQSWSLKKHFCKSESNRKQRSVKCK